MLFRSGSVVIENVRKMKAGEGYDAANNRYGNMIEFGIVDPAKVSRSAVQNAASIASLILTTEACVAEKPEKTPPTPPMPGGMDPSMMGM